MAEIFYFLNFGEKRRKRVIEVSILETQKLLYVLHNCNFGKTYVYIHKEQEVKNYVKVSIKIVFFVIGEGEGAVDISANYSCFLLTHSQDQTRDIYHDVSGDNTDLI